MTERPQSSANPAAAPEDSDSDAQVRAICEILTRVPATEFEATLSRSAITPTHDIVESVLRHSYSFPAAAVVFFRWSGLSLKHVPRSWNLMVDVLGRSALFEPMWDAIRSMKQDSTLSVSTFTSVFSSYCAANHFKEAVMSFDVMDRYGVTQDTLAVNSLLAALLQGDAPNPVSSKTALDFFDRIKATVPPDADTFAILLEGWEREGNLARAKNTFGEMVIRVGWESASMSAFDAFLSTLVRGGQPDEAIKFLRVIKSKNRLPGMKFFANAVDFLVKRNDAAHALALWDIMVVEGGLVPNLIIYHSIITLLCNADRVDDAYRLLDEMPFSGVFPDSLIYNAIFECLVRNRRVREAERFFNEMKKNEQQPLPSNCAAAVRMFFHEYDPIAAVEVWDYVVKERVLPSDDAANELLVGLSDLGRFSEVRRYAEDMLDRGILLHATTMDKLKTTFLKAGKKDVYERIARRAKRHHR